MAKEDGDALPLPRGARAAEVLHLAGTKSLAGVSGAMATVIERHGSAPGTEGQKLYLGADGSCLGTVGGGGLERRVLEDLNELVLRRGAHRVVTYKLGAELGMCCGGRVTMLIEPLSGLLPCLIVGAGHVASALAPTLARLGFAVTVVDERSEWADAARFPTARVVVGEFDDAGREIDPRGVCLVMTHDHGLDQRAIEWALGRGFRFVGGVGSRAKAERTRQRLEAKGVAARDIERVRMPLGLDIKARLPDEIAIAIAAELVRWKNDDDEPHASEASDAQR
ncbi:MAG: XdhC family protein [Myxococcales bacterium]|nr:XdhC family protein [Myxococcales bacterium]